MSTFSLECSSRFYIGKFKVGRVKSVVCKMTYEICTGATMFANGYVNVYFKIFILVPHNNACYTSE